MAKWSESVDCSLPDDVKLDMGIPHIFGTSPEGPPDYPPGLKLEIHEWLLEKLGLDHDVKPGQYLDMRCFAEVTCVHKEQVRGEDKVKVELQITRMAVEDEDEEDDKEDSK